MIATVGIAAASVSFASAWYCTRRWNSRTPPTTISRATTRKKTVKSRLLFRAGPLLPLLAMPSVVIPSLQTQIRNLSRDCGLRSHAPVPATLQPSMDNRKHARHEKQCRYGGKQQSADHREALRRVLLTAFALSTTHRPHATHQHQRRHEYGTYAHV